VLRIFRPCIVALAAFGAMALASPAHASDSAAAETREHADALEQAIASTPLVIIGRVANIRESAASERSEADFVDVETLRGAPLPTRTISFQKGGIGDCGAGLEVGKTVVVFAALASTDYYGPGRVDSCTGLSVTPKAARAAERRWRAANRARDSVHRGGGADIVLFAPPDNIRL
jgi:hypothetical protein